MLIFEEKYSKQNHILDVYMKNASIGIMVLECNNRVTGVQICKYLHTCYSLQMIDYNELPNGIVDFLREIDNSYVMNDRKFCIYNFPVKSDTVDVVKSLNISRELLKNAKRLVFIMPTLLVRQIQRYEPNLNDYIGLFLDYNENVRKSPFVPIFDVPFKKQFTRKEQASLKKEVIHIGPDISIKEYFQYLEQFRSRKLSKYEKDKTLAPALKIIWNEIALHPWNIENDDKQAMADVLYHTAIILAIQKYYKEAGILFEEMSQIHMLRDSADAGMTELQGLEGMAYCDYQLKKYEEAKKSILRAIDILENKMNPNEAWICRLNSNYAACFIQTEDYVKAVDLLENCYQRLMENHLLNLEREIRINTNRMLCYMTQKETVDLHIAMWMENRQHIYDDLGQNNIYYANNLLISAWYNSVFMGDNDTALEEAEEALAINQQLLNANAYGLAVNYCVLETIYQPLGTAEKAQQAGMRYASILQNQRSD